MDILEFLKKAQSLGVDFTFASETGWRPISAEHVEALVERGDADALNAELLGMTLDGYAQWREWQNSRHEGFQCIGTTKAGKRCRRYVMTCDHHHSFDAWKKLKEGGGYCPAHGG